MTVSLQEWIEVIQFFRGKSSAEAPDPALRLLFFSF